MSQQCNVTAEQVIPHETALIEVWFVRSRRQWSHSHTRDTVDTVGHHIYREIEANLGVFRTEW